MPSLAALSIDQAPEAGPSRRSRPAGTAASLPEELPNSLLGFAHLILRTSDPELKCLLTKEAVSRMRSGKLKSIRPSKGEIQRIRDEQGLIDEPPREVDMVAPDKAPKRYVLYIPGAARLCLGVKEQRRSLVSSCSVGHAYSSGDMLTNRRSGEYRAIRYRPSMGHYSSLCGFRGQRRAVTGRVFPRLGKSGRGRGQALYSTFQATRSKSRCTATR